MTPAHTTEGESEAMQIGRDDYKACRESDRPEYHYDCPFPQGSEDAAQWQIGWERERDGK